jgi:hypothetical protein
MTVEELINKLMEVENKQADVKLSVKLDKYFSYNKEIVDVLQEEATEVYIFNW